jgi:upstream activation factor subunit UAF30
MNNVAKAKKSKTTASNSTETKKSKTSVKKSAPVVEKEVKKQPVKSRKSQVKEEVVVAPETVEVTDSVSSSEKVVEPVVKTRKTVDKEYVLNEFDNMSSLIEQEIENLRQNPKANSVKFLRTLNKQVKTLQKDSSRVMKQKVKTERKNNATSGFLKPVNISTELSSFTGWNPEELRSRVEVTKYICDYIKENNLQNPEDRREIKPDPKLQKLLGLKNKDTLKYYSLQTHLKQHFPKTE